MYFAGGGGSMLTGDTAASVAQEALSAESADTWCCQVRSLAQVAPLQTSS